MGHNDYIAFGDLARLSVTHADALHPVP